MKLRLSFCRMLKAQICSDVDRASLLRVFKERSASIRIRTPLYAAFINAFSLHRMGNQLRGFAELDEPITCYVFRGIP